MLLVIHDMHSDCVKWMIDTIKIFQVNILPHGRFKWSSVIKSIRNELSSIDQKDGLNEKDAMNLLKIDLLLLDKLWALNQI